MAIQEHIKNRGKALLYAGCLLLIALICVPRPGQACDVCSCVPQFHGTPYPIPPGYTDGGYGDDVTIRGVIRREHEITTDHLLEEFEDLEEFLVDESNPLNTDRIFGAYLLPAWMMMTEQLVHTAIYQTFILGTFFDAKLQLETQTLFQKLATEAHKDYHPSHDMCVFGTNMRSLATAERRAEYATYVLSQRSIDRQMGNMETAGARGQFDDHCFRLRQFRRRYCDMRDNNEHMQWVCDPVTAASDAGTGFVPFRPECIPASQEITDASKNKDISFTRTVDRANTLEIITEGTASDDQEDLFALASNLYGHDVMFRMPDSALRQRQSQDELLDMRHIVAKRAVAEHSFNTIVGMKAQGSELSTAITYPYMTLILQGIGLGDAGPFEAEELALLLGERPSYEAQMEVLTKRIFQSTDFYVNLYDEPANVERKGVALQAIGLMQDFDTWNSYLRTEAMLSVILELELLRLNNQVQNQMGNMRYGGLPL